MNLLLIWINNPLPTEHRLCLKTLRKFITGDDKVNIITNIEDPDFKGFNIINSDEYIEQNIPKDFISKCICIQNLTDYMRYHWLSINSGTYFDIDTIHYRDFHFMRPFNFIMNFDEDKNYYNALIHAVNQQERFKELLNSINELKELKYFDRLYFEMNKCFKHKPAIGITWYSPFTYEEQCKMWLNPNEEQVQEQLKNSLDSGYKGLFLMHDVDLHGNDYREKYISHFIENNLIK